MNKTHTLSSMVIGVLMLGAVSASFGGDLNPGPGPIAPTMVPLDKLAPGKCLNELPGDATSTHLITEPGTYFLSDDIVGEQGKNAIEIAVHTYDLGEYWVRISCNGHTITGVPGSGDAIHASSGGTGQILHVVVTDNTGLSSFPRSAISGFDGDGIDADQVASLAIEGLAISGCGGSGVHATGTPTGYTFVNVVNVKTTANATGGINGEDFREYRLSNVSATGNGGNGVECVTPPSPGAYVFELKVVDASSNSGSGVVLTANNGRPNAIMHDCTFSENAGNGAEIFSITGRGTVATGRIECTGNGGSGLLLDLSGSSGGDLTVAGSTFSSNVVHGIHVRGDNLESPVPGEPVKGINVSLEQIAGGSNGGDGTRVEFDASAAPSLRVSSSSFRDNTGDGLYCVGTSTDTLNDIRVRDSDASANGGSGLRVAGDLTVSACTASDNGGDGLEYTASSKSLKKGNSVQLIGFGSFKNDGNGATSTWHQLDGPFTFSASGCSFDHNALTGCLHDDEADLADVQIEMDGCSATGNGTGGFVETHVASAAAKKSWKHHVHSRANAGPGFSVTGASVEFSGCAASDNTGDGFHVEPSAGGAADEVYSFDRTTSLRNGGGGLVLSGGSADLRNVTARGNGSDGINLTEGTGISLIGPICSNNGGSGASLDVSGTLTVQGASMCDNSGNGVLVFSAGGINALAADFKECVLSGNGVAGLSLSGVASGRVRDCAAFSNGNIGIQCLSLAHVLTNNTAGNNGPGGASNYSVMLPGNAVGSVVDQTNISTTDNASNYSP